MSSAQHRKRSLFQPSNHHCLPRNQIQSCHQDKCLLCRFHQCLQSTTWLIPFQQFQRVCIELNQLCGTIAHKLERRFLIWQSCPKTQQVLIDVIVYSYEFLFLWLLRKEAFGVSKSQRNYIYILIIIIEKTLSIANNHNFFKGSS